MRLRPGPNRRRGSTSRYLANGGKGPVFGSLRAPSRLPRSACQGEYAAPEFTWPALRRTCGTFLTNAPGIFGAASAYRSAQQLGHRVQIAEKHYLGVVRGNPRDARTLDAAMQLDDALGRVVALAGMRTGASQTNVVRLSS